MKKPTFHQILASRKPFCTFQVPESIALNLSHKCQAVVNVSDHFVG